MTYYRPLLLFAALATNVACPNMHARVGIDYREKMIRAEKLVADAAAFFEKTSRTKACRDFTYNDRWHKGSLTLFVNDIAGNRLVSHNYPASVWENDLNLKNLFDEPAFPLMLEAARKKGGGWVPYFFLNSLVYVYVKAVEKNKQTAVIGTCIFCDDQPDLVCRLLLKAIDRYGRRKKSMSDVFDIISNTHGPCIYGDIYATVIDTDGICWADGENQLLVKQNLLDSSYRDAPVVRTIIDFVKTNTTGVIEARIGTYTKKIYFKTMINPYTKKTLISMAGYSPTLNQNAVLQKIKKIKKLFAEHDLDEALAIINNIRRTPATPKYALLNDGLHCMILDHNYTVLAYDREQDYALIGRNYLTYVDQKEMPFAETIKSKIDADGKGWIMRHSHNTLEHLYAEKIDTQSGPAIAVIFGYYPHDQQEIGEMLTDAAYHLLNIHPSPKTLETFVETDGPFIKGNMQILLYDAHGFCWTDGMTKTAIWSQDTTWPQAAEGWVDDRRTNNVLKRFKKNIGALLPGIDEEFMIGTTYLEDAPSIGYRQ